MKEADVGVGRFRKKPVVIRAVRFTKGVLPADLHAVLGTFEGVTLGVDHILIETLEGTMRADLGDWIIRGVKGEIYPCKPDIFAATYEPADTPPPSSAVTEAEKGLGA